jgi:hypothetical protein
MSYKQRVIDLIEKEWGVYVERFNRLPEDEKTYRVSKQGYESFRDILAHVVAWWEEGMPIVLAIAENREYERKKYDYDVFNAEAVAKYKSWDEKEFLNHFEQVRLQCLTDLKKIDESAFENRRVKSWLNGIFIHHAREHLVALGKFLTLDTLEHEWGTLIKKFDALENKDEYLKNQQLTRFEDILVHSFAWWDEGVKAVQGALKDSSFVYKGPADVDAYNAEIVQKYQSMNVDDVRKLFEQKRIELIELIQNLPESAFNILTIEEWLAADIVEHFDEHNV